MMILSTKNSSSKHYNFRRHTASAILLQLASLVNWSALVIIPLLLFSVSLFSQNQPVQKNYKQLIYFEADPFAYINNGYSIHLGYENWGMRFDLTKVKVDFPESFMEGFYDSKTFDLTTRIAGIKVDYIGNRSNWTKNAFIGLDINHQKQSFTHNESFKIKDLNTFNIGLRTGYKFNIFKGIYVTPWTAVWKNIAATESFQEGQDIISTKEWDWIATFHIGYAIKL